MYIPSHYNITEWELQKFVIEQFPLATLITSTDIKDPEYPFIVSHVPLLLVEDESTDKKYLIAHLAKRNHQIKHLENGDGYECMVVFQSTDSYISPSWYPLKNETHKVVPTWDFASVHIYGKPKIIKNENWILETISKLTEQEENKRPNDRIQGEKWKVSDAPKNFTSLMLKNIVGLEIEIKRVESKFKFQQDKPKREVQGIVDGLEKEVDEGKSKMMILFTKNMNKGNKD